MQTIEQIRANAPEGATHYRKYKNRVRYYRLSTMGYWFVFTENSLMPTSAVKIKPL